MVDMSRLVSQMLHSKLRLFQVHVFPPTSNSRKRGNLCAVREASKTIPRGGLLLFLLPVRRQI